MSDEDQLTSAERDLERALRSLRPTPARINPVAAALAAGRRARPVPLRFWQFAATAAAIVVGGGAWLMLRPREQMPSRIEHPIFEPELAAVTGSPLEPPTLLVYRRALAHSPAELDDLLDRQATTGARPDNQFTAAGVLTLWNADLHPSLGEM
jgi:hypothetical protein